MGTGLTFTCTYNFGTGKFTVAAGSTFTMSVSATNSPGWAMLGYRGSASATSFTGSFPRWLDTFWISTIGGSLNPPSLALPFGTGTNAASTIAPVIGFQPVDYASALEQQAPFMRGLREAVADASAALWGERPEESVAAEYIRNEQVAALFRNRLFDAASSPPVVVKFKSPYLPDIRRLELIEFGSTIDSWVPYPRPGTDGTWGGRLFRVIEGVQKCGRPEWHGEYLAVEV